MPAAMIAVSTESPFAFDLDAFGQTIRARWPEAAFVPASGPFGAVSRGQWQVPHRGAFPDVVLIEFDIEGKGLTFESPADGLRAEAIAIASTLPGFPDDGSAILAEWAPEFVPLHPQTTVDELLALIRT